MGEATKQREALGEDRSLGLEEALEALMAEARTLGVDQCDILAGESENTSVEVFEQKIKSTEMSSSRGIGVRLFRNGRPGYSFTERLTPAALRQAALDAVAHTELTDELDLALPSDSPPKRDLGTYAAELEAIRFDDLRALALALEDKARAADRRIENVPYAGASLSSGRSMLANSRGLYSETKGNSVSAFLGAVALEGDIRKMGVYANGGRSLGLPVLQPDFIAARAVERAVEMLAARPIEGGAIPIVFSNRVSGRLFSMFASPFFAEAVQKGQSRLKGKIGQQIASPVLRLRDDPHIFGAPGSRICDGEGVLTTPMEVVREGVLTGFLYNLEAAAEDNAAPTGHGSRSYAGRAGTSFTNLIVEPGQTSTQDLLAARPRCLFVNKLEGGAGCSSISGEISIGMQGFLYENGRPVHPVDKMTISTNWFDLLPKISLFSNEYSDAFRSVRVPDMLVDDVFVGA